MSQNRVDIVSGIPHIVGPSQPSGRDIDRKQGGIRNSISDSVVWEGKASFLRNNHKSSIIRADWTRYHDPDVFLRQRARIDGVPKHVPPMTAEVVRWSLKRS